MPPTIFPPNQLPPALCPVLLTGDTDLKHWPLSRIRMPLAFQKEQGLSPFEQALEGLNLLHHSLPPVLTVPSAVLSHARTQIAGRRTRCIVEPVDRGSLAGAMAAAIVTAQTDRNARLLFIDGSTPPEDWLALHRFCQSTLASPLQETGIIMAGQPVTHASPGQKLARVAKTTDPNLVTCRKAREEEEGRVYRLGPVMVATARIFLQRCQTLWPNLFATVSRALNQSKIIKGDIWPDLNHWAHLETHSLFDAMADRETQLLLRPLDLTARTSNQPTAKSADVFSFQLACDDCEIEAQDHVVAAYGVSNLRVISTADATLITPANSNADITPIVEQLKRSECPEVYDFPVQHFSWGNLRELASTGDHAIMRLTLMAGQSIPAHVHHQRDECWHVLQGEGEAVVGDQTHAVKPGMTIKLPAATKHALHNMGATPLMLVEIRRGTVLSDRDTHPARRKVAAPSVTPEADRPISA
ncbi:MAG: cupin domain-containing protein [Pseudomonadota bacterium]